MAEDKKSLPMFPENRWWQLRKKFVSTVPKNVDAKYLSTIFDIGEPAAKNLIPALKQIGLIDDQNKPTELANEWRHDDTYATACKNILGAVYPDGLKDVASGPDVNKQQATTWISKHLSVGSGAAGKMASLYKLVAEADHTKENESQTGAAKETKAKSQKETPKKRTQTLDTSKELDSDKLGASDQKPDVDPNRKPGLNPTVHLDIQIHISPEANNEQIEKIFEAMGKHIFNRS